MLVSPTSRSSSHLRTRLKSRSQRPAARQVLSACSRLKSSYHRSLRLDLQTNLLDTWRSSASRCKRRSKLKSWPLLQSQSNVSSSSQTTCPSSLGKRSTNLGKTLKSTNLRSSSASCSNSCSQMLQQTEITACRLNFVKLWFNFKQSLPLRTKQSSSSK